MMWKQYMVYHCPKCGYEKKTSRKIYRFDDDGHHYREFHEDRDMKDALRAIQLSECPECGSEKGLTFKEWSDW